MTNKYHTDLIYFKINELRDYLEKICDTFDIKDKPTSRRKDELIEYIIDILKQHSYIGLWNTTYIDCFLNIYNKPQLLEIVYNENIQKYYIDDQIITLIENKTNLLNNFEQNNILFSIKTMEQQNQSINPLEQLVARTITINDLLNIYNRYAPQPLSMQQLLLDSQNDQDIAKAYLLNQILSHARDGDLVRNGGGFSSERIGMNQLANIVLNLQRDVQRVKKAISPKGAEEIVIKHNTKASPNARWFLNKKNQDQPASLTNLTDVNNDGIPDVVILNSKNQPLYVNGYTTSASNHPLDLAYYNQYPSRADRKDHPLNAFKKELYAATYDDNNDDFTKRGDLLSFHPKVEYLEGYNLDKFHIPQPRPRLSSFNRFKKYVVSPLISDVLDALNIPPNNKLSATSIASSTVWKELVLKPIYEKYGVQNDKQAAKIKKKAALEIDNRVNEILANLNNKDTVDSIQILLANALDENGAEALIQE